VDRRGQIPVHGVHATGLDGHVQILLAVVTRSSSLRHCASSSMRLPSGRPSSPVVSAEANPHCGEIELLERDVPRGAVDRGEDVVGRFELGVARAECVEVDAAGAHELAEWGTGEHR
jgi:hypothetical protein